MKKRHLLFLLSLTCLLGWSWPFSWFFSGTKSTSSTNNHQQPTKTQPIKAPSQSWVQREVQLLKAQAKNIDTNVLRLSLIAYQKARLKGLGDKQVLTVIDYSKPSTQPRLWVFDLKRGKTLFNTWVSHGVNSGGVVPTSFSNKTGSLKSSVGVFVTDHQPYMGRRGYALRLKGLESGVNDNAYNRAVVFHGAPYADPAVIKYKGQLGRSWGCPAVNTRVAKPLINAIKDKTVVFAYYPDRNWLKHSSFLTA